MATFKFVVRPSTKVGRHMGSISLRVIHGRKSKTVSICRRLFPDEWSEASQHIIYPVNDPQRIEYLKAIEEHIEVVKEKMNEVIRKLEDQGIFTADHVIDSYCHATDKKKLLGYAGMLSANLNENGQYRTAKAYGTVCRGLVAFNNGIDIPLTAISSSLIRMFENHLKESNKLPNTISYYMRNLRAIYNKAVGTGRIPKDGKPFSGVFTGVEETRKRALTAGEVNQIKNIDLDLLLQKHGPDTRKGRDLRNLEHARLLFIFSICAHGMCFVDLCYLKKTQLKNGVIRYYRKKTGRQIEVPVNKEMLRIIKHFAPEVKDSEYLFPLLTSGGTNLRLQYETAMRTQNKRLKKIAALAGLDEGITTHVARHSWASILKNKMQPISVISEGLGHSSEKTTRKYLASFDRSILVKAGRMVLMAISQPSKLPLVAQV